MDVTRGLGERGSGTVLAGVENLMLHFTPYAEDWSKLPVIVSGEGCYVTDEKGRSYIDGLAGLFTTQVGHGRTEHAEVAARQMKELGFFPNWSFQHPRSLELTHRIAEIAPGDRRSGYPGGKVTIIGGGVVGTEAAKVAVGMRAIVRILDVHPKRPTYRNHRRGGVQYDSQWWDENREPVTDRFSQWLLG
jgi:hypothetical protein